jgi:IPTL-CTERM motif
MKTAVPRLAAVCAIFTLLAAVAAGPVHAARVGVLSDNCAQCPGTAVATAADFSAKIPGHTFTGIDTSQAVPTLPALLSSYDVLLVFEDGRYANSKAVGNVAAAFANVGRAVVLGAFYDQDRSDAANPAITLIPVPGGWGGLEAIDPDTTDGLGVRTDASGVPNLPRVLNIGSLIPHPLTKGITALTASSGFAGGNQAKPGTVVVGNWTEANARGQPDPAIAYRITGAACVVQIGIAPDYGVGVGSGYGAGNFTGDFYVLWKNAFDFAATSCGTAGGNAIPTLSDAGLALTILLVVAVAFSQRRRTTRLG